MQKIKKISGALLLISAGVWGVLLIFFLRGIISGEWVNELNIPVSTIILEMAIALTIFIGSFIGGIFLLKRRGVSWKITIISLIISVVIFSTPFLFMFL